MKKCYGIILILITFLFEKYVSKDEALDVFFFGPNAMRMKIRNDLKKAGYKIKEFHYEFFQFK